MNDTQLMGYVRSDGRVGCRNHLLVLPTVNCAAVVCERICEGVAGTVTFSHQHGCSQIGADAAQTFRALRGMACNPNVGAVLVVSLGCEVVDAVELTEQIRQSGKPVELIRIQEVGGSLRAIQRGIEVASRMSASLQTDGRQPVPWDALHIAIKWGDGLSGMPSDGTGIESFQDHIVGCGGSLYIGEIQKIERHYLLHPGDDVNQKTLTEIRERIAQQPDVFIETDIRLRSTPMASQVDPFVGDYPNFLRHPVTDVLDYGATPTKPGLHVIDGPASDVPCLSGFASAGATLTVFFTSHGTPVGNPIMPVLKVMPARADNHPVSDDVDMILADLDGTSDWLTAAIETVFSGELTAAEMLGHAEFAIHRIGPSL